MSRLNLSLLVLIAIAFAASLLAGRVWLPPSALLSPPDSLAGLIIHDIRLPRTVLALITGSVLGLSPTTVRNYTSNAITKVGARNRIDAIRIARDAGWI